MRALPALTVADDTPTSATGAVLVKQRSSRRVAMRPTRRGAGIDRLNLSADLDIGCYVAAPAFLP